MISSNRYICAFNWSTNNNGSLGVSVIEEPGRRSPNAPLIHAHASTVTDLALSRFCVGDESVLYTGGEDGVVKVWKVPNSGLKEDLSEPVASLIGNRKITAVRPHPTATEIIATGSFDKVVRVFDVANEEEKASIDAEGNVWDVAWSGDGKLIAGMVNDKKIRIMDPRSNEVTSVADGEAGMKPAKCVWAGSSGCEYIVTTSFSKYRERVVNVYDPKDMSKPLKRHVHDSSSGILLPFFDYDTSLLGLAGKGDTTIRLFDVGGTKDVITELTMYKGDSPQKGAAMGIKTSCNVMECEVVYFLRLGANRIERISAIAPRKTHFDFHEDLYPETLGDVSNLTGEEWLNGEDRNPDRVSLDPNVRTDGTPSSYQRKDSNASTDSASRSPSVSSPATSSPGIHSPAGTSPGSMSPRASRGSVSEPPAEPKGQWVERDIKDMSGIIRSTRYRHIYGKLWKKEQGCLDLKPKPGTVQLLDVNKRFAAIPWVGPGGRVGLVPIPLPSRAVPEELYLANPERSEVTALKLSTFDPNILLVGYQDAVVSMFVIPDEPSSFPSVRDFYGHELKITALVWHPMARNIFLSSSYDGWVRVWNTEEENEVFSVQVGEPIIDAAWDIDGSSILAVSRDCKVHSIDPRDGTVRKSTEGHETDKGFRIVPLTHNKFLTCGFSKSSGRELKVYDSIEMELLNTIPLDNNNGVLLPYYDYDTGVLFVAGKGGTTMFIYELSDDSPYLHSLTEYKGKMPVIAGISGFHKLSCDVKECEISRYIIYSSKRYDICSFFVPRNHKEYFQDVIYPPTFADEASMDADAWIGGSDEGPLLVDLQPEGMEKLSDHPELVEKKKSVRRFVTEEEEQEDELDKDKLMDKVSGYMTSHHDDILKWEDPAEKMEGVEDDEWSDSDDDSD